MMPNCTVAEMVLNIAEPIIGPLLNADEIMAAKREIAERGHGRRRKPGQQHWCGAAFRAARKKTNKAQRAARKATRRAAWKVGGRA